ncbi:MAG: outer membrane protein assembly factor [Pasteurella sp.]|nr:outer membrane protein assembly factor [Pasteurella sp.]
MDIKAITCIFFTCSSIVWAGQGVQLDIKGIKNTALLENVNLHLSQIDKEESDGSERHKYLVTQIADKALRSEGYYRSKFDFSQPQKDKIILNITLDKPVRLDKRVVQIAGDASKNKDFNQLIEKEVPKKGTILNHKTYDNFKSKLENLAQNQGYFDSHWLFHRLEIYPTKYLANWQLGYDSGERYHYGKINFKDSQIDQTYLENILKIKSGEPYLMSDLSTLTNDLSSSKWFSSVLIDPKIQNELKAVDLDVLLLPRKKNRVEIGIGYETNVGPHLQLNWKKPWINKYGHSIETNTYLSKPRQSIDFAYNLPLKSHPLSYYYQLAASLENEDVSDIQNTTATLSLQRFWNDIHSWSYNLGLKMRYDHFIENGKHNKTFLLYPTASFKRIRSDGKAFPQWGDSQQITLNYADKALKSDVNFYSIKASTAWVRTYNINHRVYLRAELGYLHSNEFEKIPLTLRFFAGGDSSVRGFGYKTISPRNPKTGKLMGASRLATATAEYQYQVAPSWWGALFYDTGLAADNFDKKNLYSGAGLGIRWISPIGAIKFDIATPIKSPDNRRGIHYYIGLGSEL